MRFRSISILASLGLLALWGCPVGNAPGSGGGSPSGADSNTVSAGAGFGNTAAHDDPVDLKDDTSWADGMQVAQGSSAVRLLMTDAPVDADHVFVTFCGVRVAAGRGAPEPQPAPGTASGGGADAGAPHAGDETEKSAAADRGEGAETEAQDGAGAPQTEPSPVADAGAPAPEPSAHEADPSGGWISISNECQTLDLLTLQNGVTEAIGINTLPAGSYGQIRLMLTEASIVKDGLTQPLTIPSGSESGVKIIGGFSIADGQPLTVTIDFDAGSSIHYAAGKGFIMDPVIRIVDVMKHGDGSQDESGDGSGRDVAGGPGTSAPAEGPSTDDGRGSHDSAGAAGAADEDPAAPDTHTVPAPGDAHPPAAGGDGGSGGAGSADDSAEDGGQGGESEASAGAAGSTS